MRAFLNNRNRRRKFKAALWEMYKQCFWCHDPLSLESATIEHVVPRATGGETTLDNCRLACRWCNQARGIETNPVLVRRLSFIQKAKEAAKAHRKQQLGTKLCLAPPRP